MEGEHKSSVSTTQVVVGAVAVGAVAAVGLWLLSRKVSEAGKGHRSLV